ncbi:MAG: DUF4290 domain-containing protein [Prevotella sp.]|jgi:hypothetical protein|nr:DUF4290 domain-containing protein [Prevotella sp.]
MEIQGLDYNTQRESLQMPEYGREIQKMVDHAVSLSSRQERLRCAMAIVKQMENKVPQIRENANYKQTLWDHLYLMSHKQLDIDWPFDVSGAEVIHSKPQPMKLPQSQIRLRHYGRLVEELLEKLKTMPEGNERDELVRLTANQMKRDLMQWGHGSADNEKVADDLARLTDGVIQLDLGNFRFDRVSVAAEPGKRTNNKRRK